MANSDTPFGFQPIFPRGSNSTSSIQKMYLPADYLVSVFIGDHVIKVAAGSNDVVVATIGGTYQIGTLPEINIGVTTDTSRSAGVVVGFEALTRDSTVYGATGTVRVALVVDDPYQEFLVQSPTAIGPLDYGLHADGLVTHGGSTVTGLSGMELDGSDIGSDPSAPFFVLRAHNAPDNETNAAFNKVIVRLNLHSEAADAAGMTGI